MAAARPFIAVVDDEVAFRKAISRLLRIRGMEVESFSSGTDFLQFVQKRRPDCLVLDVHLPGLNGLELQDRLAEAGISLPVVLVTGRDEPEARNRGMAAGAAAFLLKPLDERDLMNAIELAIREWKALHELKFRE
jgi:FixJ family two-component response regulator